MLSSLLTRFRRNWRQFLIIHLCVSVLVLLVLTPLATLLLHFVVELSGKAALSDQDIFLFALSPAGLGSFLLVGSVFGIILILEMSALMIAASFDQSGTRVQSFEVTVFLTRRLSALFSIAARVLLRILLLVAPFGLLLFLIYKWLLGEHDINYYLATRPPEFLKALWLAGLVLVTMASLLARQFISWILALPMLLFDDESPAAALQKSKEVVRGQQLRIGGWLAAWLLADTASVVLVSGSIAMLGNRLVPAAVTSLHLLIIVLAVLVLIALLLNLIRTWFSSSLLSLLILVLFEQHRPAMLDTQPRPVRASQGFWRLATARNLTLLLLLAVIATMLVVNGLLSRLQMEDQTSVIAHRGASAIAPENTLSAIETAIGSGADWVEIDVQETADGVVVVIHDSDLKKVSGAEIKVAESSFAELHQYDIGSWFDPGFSDQRIETLATVLEHCRGRIGVNIELKYYGNERQLEQGVVEAVEAAGMQDQIVVMSLSYPGIQRMRAIRPDWKLGLLSSVMLGNMQKLDVDFFALNARLATRSLVQATHHQGKEILAWTVNDTLSMNNMISRGVDGIITDEPAMAVALLEQRAELDTSQRLLMQLADIFDQPSLYREQ